MNKKKFRRIGICKDCLLHGSCTNPCEQIYKVKSTTFIKQLGKWMLINKKCPDCLTDINVVAVKDINHFDMSQFVALCSSCNNGFEIVGSTTPILCSRTHLNDMLFVIDTDPQMSWDEYIIKLQNIITLIDVQLLETMSHIKRGKKRMLLLLKYMMNQYNPSEESFDFSIGE